MNRSKPFVIILLVLFTSQTILIFSSERMKYTNSSSQPIKTSLPQEEELFEINAVSGVENVKSNVIRDGGFEESDSLDGPEYFNYWGTGYEISNASYQDDVHSGSYGMLYSVQGTDQQSSNIYTNRLLTSITERAYLVEDISLDMWFKVKSNPDFTSGAYSSMYLRVYTGSQNYYLYYYFSRSGALSSNSTYYCNYDVREPVGSWIHLQRNITRDFEAGFPSVPITSSFYISYLYFRAFSIINPTGPIEMLVDDISIANSTAFNFLHENGDFEDGNGYRWNTFRSGPATVKITEDDYTQGSRSLNMTSSAFYDNSNSYLYCEKRIATGWGIYPDTYYPIEPGDVVMNYDWKYSDNINGGTSQEAYAYLYLENDTYGAYLYFMLGEDNDVIPYSNSTQPSSIYRYYKAPGFGNRDTWEHFSLDLYDICQMENLQNLAPMYIGWMVHAGYYANSTVQLLVDDLSVVADPLGDPSFEQADDWNPNDPLNSWTSASHTYVNRTTDTHTGTYAANVTSHSGLGNIYCSRYAYLPIETNLYTDFWWRLDELTGPTTAYSYIYLELDDNYYLHYILGSSAATSFSNSTYQCYFYPENFNQIGVWTNLFRNVMDDAITAFGDANWNITAVRVGCFSMVATFVSTIFDDMYFVRDVTGPEITNFVQTPTEPQYGEAVTIEVEVTDNLGIFEVELYYKVDTGSWVAVPMTNTGGSIYESTILAYDFNTNIHYYIAAYDVHGLETLLGSEISPFEYIVVDLIDPILDVEAPLTTEPMFGAIIFNITGEDPGSGIASFEIEIGSETVLSDTSIPAEFTWQTTDYENDNYTITFTLVDNAGNIAQLVLEYVIENPIPWHIQTWDFFKQWWPYLTAGAGALVVGILAIVIVVKVKKRRAA